MAIKKISKNDLKESLIDTPQEVIDELISILGRYGFKLDPVYKSNIILLSYELFHISPILLSHTL